MAFLEEKLHQNASTMIESLWNQLANLGTAYAVLVMVVLWVVHKFVDNYRAHSFFQKYSIPGPKPTMFFGNMLSIRANGKMPHEIMAGWFREYGNVFGIYSGKQPTLVINDPDIIKDIMIRHFQNFTDRPAFPISLKPISDSLIMAKGHKWRDTRSLLTPAFSGSKLKVLTKAMNEQTDTLVSLLGHNSEDNVVERVQALTLDVIGQCALALNVDCQRNSNDNFLIAVREFFKHAGNNLVRVAMAFPFVRYPLLFVNNYLTAGRMADMLVRSLKEVIKMRRTDGNAKSRTDMLQMLLDAEEAGANNDDDKVKRKTLTDAEVIANAYLFILAGYETTATTLGFVFYLLTMHPEIQENLYREIMDKVADVSHPTYDQAHSIPYLDQVINESLRVFPVVPHFVVRRTLEDINIQGLLIPKGVNIQVPVWQLHHDPESWFEPDKFNPDRFAPENKETIRTGSFLPFGIGPRNCIGLRFAQLEMKLAIIKTLKKFKLVPSPKTEIPLTLTCPSVLLSSKNGIFLQFLQRD